jgi:hypothetical protein
MVAALAILIGVSLAIYSLIDGGSSRPLRSPSAGYNLSFCSNWFAVAPVTGC